jgi:AraC-like DNA-binding protein
LLWTGGSTSRGYGIAHIDRRNVYAHRLAWAFGLLGERHGAMPPPEVVIRHRCDVPRCCNPEHLQAGSHADNARDAVERGRLARGDAHYSRKHPERLARGDANGSRKRPERLARGEAHPAAKLSDAAVAKVHELSEEGLKQREIATLVGCSRQHVSRILRGLMRAQQNTL